MIVNGWLRPLLIFAVVLIGCLLAIGWQQEKRVKGVWLPRFTHIDSALLTVRNLAVVVDTHEVRIQRLEDAVFSP
jgi:hypothetical protein